MLKSTLCCALFSVALISGLYCATLENFTDSKWCVLSGASGLFLFAILMDAWYESFINKKGE